MLMERWTLLSAGKGAKTCSTMTLLIIHCTTCKAATTHNPWLRGHCRACWEQAHPKDATLNHQRLIAQLQDALNEDVCEDSKGVRFTSWRCKRFT